MTYQDNLYLKSEEYNVKISHRLHVCQWSVSHRHQTER